MTRESGREEQQKADLVEFPLYMTASSVVIMMKHNECWCVIGVEAGLYTVKRRPVAVRGSDPDDASDSDGDVQHSIGTWLAYRDHRTAAAQAFNMAPSGTMTPEDKTKVKKVMAAGAGSKILTATVARVYQAKQGEDAWVGGHNGVGWVLTMRCLVRSWAYTGIQGALVFCLDKGKGGLWFRVVDLMVSSSEADGASDQALSSTLAGHPRYYLGARAASRDRIQPGPGVLPFLCGRRE